MKNKYKINGIRSYFVFIPTIIVMAFLYTSIIIATVFINIHSKNLIESIEKTNEVTDWMSNIQGGSSKLHTTSTSFTYSPWVLKPDGTKAINPETGNYIIKQELITTYVSELEVEEKKPDVIMNNIKNYNLDNETYVIINDAAKQYKLMMEYQQKAIYIINSITGIEIPSELLNKIPLYELSDYENTLNDDQKQKYALDLFFSNEYSQAQKNISESMRAATININKNASNVQDELVFKLKFARGYLWGSILLILISNVIFFFILLTNLVIPINRFSKRINENKPLEAKRCLYEANYLAKAYNDLLSRHKEFEQELRKVAEIDSLTQLPNRYCYNEFLKNVVPSGKSVCVFLFDINNLKYVNDTFGHNKGDELIKSASKCITDVFLDDDGKNCYRIGGDEFVSILEGIEEKDIHEYLEEFNEKMNQYNVSIAVGYEFTTSIESIGYEKLIIKADKKMYKNKKAIKKEMEANEA